jgi:hypothetical protein
MSDLRGEKALIWFTLGKDRVTRSAAWHLQPEAHPKRWCRPVSRCVKPWGNDAVFYGATITERRTGRLRSMVSWSIRFRASN